ncbi:hypothetical protein GLOTRDRAFT_127139 [Gloeophyllum trabeum ATCC 11539]|uniref:Uncharacterized protein n=1 Tax=Gloeophyllum trabeum (strain ATCC 11539 / FP-39264 / Madison 617) TaxID=670483 RepID=S7RYZ2_GLOTA|nr:uncharacterized protein GLOTRDRAFT_127139 [Gloeophyllum trabeum ATCC 11539]EPQ58649.1 hypothetical protein GLOTRDRAFT_127139 [Gloeophyllum trabeum ATCC 11539]
MADTLGNSTHKNKGKGKAQEPKNNASKQTSGYTVRKLNPRRPFPTVPSSVSATGPRSAHTEGKNYICISRKTPLAAYLRRCKDIILKDGYKSLHLSAMGAAIPHLLLLSTSLPSILPFSPDEIHTEVRTGTVEVQDELIPEDEDEDISYRTRGKSSLSIVIKIGEGDPEDEPRVSNGKGKGNGKRSAGAQGGGEGKRNKTSTPEGGKEDAIVFQEPEQENMDES